MPDKYKSEKIKTILKEIPSKKEYLLSALHKLQEANERKYIDEYSLDACCEHFGLTKSQVYGVVTYYSMFSLKPKGKHHICICKSPVCNNQGSIELYNFIKEKYIKNDNNLSVDGTFSIEQVECLGRCGKAPSMTINEEVYTEITKEKIISILENLQNLNHDGK